VYATFQVLIQRIDEKKKDVLKADLYAQRREVVGDTRAGGHMGEDETDDEDLLGYESVEPYLLLPIAAWILIFARSTRQSPHTAAV
jgi:hypothetical protein